MNLATCMLYGTIFHATRLATFCVSKQRASRPRKQRWRPMDVVGGGVKTLLLVDGVDCDEEESKVKRERELLLQLAPASQRHLMSHYSQGLLKSASLRRHNQQQTPFCLFTSQVPWDFPGLVKFRARSEAARILGRRCAKNRRRPCYTSQLSEYSSSCVASF